MDEIIAVLERCGYLIVDISVLSLVLL